MTNRKHMQLTTGRIYVYCKNYNLSKVVVSPEISSTTTFTCSNKQIVIGDLCDNLLNPINISAFGGNFLSKSVATSYRLVNLFNQTAIRFDYDLVNRTMTFSNVTPMNLGCASLAQLPENESLIAVIYVTFCLVDEDNDDILDYRYVEL